MFNEVKSSRASFPQFMFVEGQSLTPGDQPYKMKETLKSLSPTGAVITTTRTTFSKPGDQGESKPNVWFNMGVYLKKVSVMSRKTTNSKIEFEES